MTQAVILGGRFQTAIQEIIDTETALFDKGATHEVRAVIPDTTAIPIKNPQHWFKIPDVVACFVDMEGSTRLSANTHGNGTAKIYRYFTETAVRIFHEFDAPYIDVRGDGVFALFNYNQVHTALAATVSFRTFVMTHFTPRVLKLTGMSVGGHFGIDMHVVMVRKLGLKSIDGRTDRQNEVWAGRPINMAAKLASRSANGEIWVSNRYHAELKGPKALMSCGCISGVPESLWRDVDISEDDRFDFNGAKILKSPWCSTHGRDFCHDIVEYDAKR